jgi:hypothetical protein
MKFLMIIVIFLLLGAFFIISNNNIMMNSSENVDKFISLYGSWIDRMIVNGESVSGYLVKMEWLPDKT